MEAQYSTSSPEFSTSRPDELSTSSESLEFSKNAWEDEKGHFQRCYFVQVTRLATFEYDGVLRMHNDRVHRSKATPLDP